MEYTIIRYWTGERRKTQERIVKAELAERKRREIERLYPKVIFAN